MTVSELIRYFGDGDMFPNPKQEVKFMLCPEGAAPSVKLDIRSTIVPEKGEAVVKLEPAPKKRKFMFSLKFKANPVIEAESLEEAKRKAFEMMRDVGVTRQSTSGIFEDMPEYEAQEPCCLEEVEE